MTRSLAGTALAVVVSTQVSLAQPSLPATFNSRMVASPEGANISVRCFAETRHEPVVVEITGMGPSSTRYIDPSSDPRTFKKDLDTRSRIH